MSAKSEDYTLNKWLEFYKWKQKIMSTKECTRNKQNGDVHFTDNKIILVSHTHTKIKIVKKWDKIKANCRNILKTPFRIRILASKEKLDNKN